jgi:hypothetical protein
MRKLLIAGSILLLPLCAAQADVSISVDLAGVDIGINVPVYPQLQQVPGYPVYYAPNMDSNFFFYDGQYWVYQHDSWFRSDWYNGPWLYTDPDYVPLFILRVPLRYYAQPPVYFRDNDWNRSPHWGDHWGPDWQQRRDGWDRWDRHAVPPAAPLPDYQRRYSGNAYPHSSDQQHSIQSRSYHYQQREPVTVHNAAPQGGAYSRGAAPGQQGRAYEPAPLQHKPQSGAPVVTNRQWGTAPASNAQPADQGKKPMQQQPSDQGRKPMQQQPQDQGRKPMQPPQDQGRKPMQQQEQGKKKPEPQGDQAHKKYDPQDPQQNGRMQ